MIHPSRPARLLAATSLSLSFALGGVAAAQVPPPPAGAAAPDTGAPPPGRVGRLSEITGSVSFHAARSEGWSAAAINVPVTSGDAVFVQAGGHAELEVGNDVVALDGATELDMATLDDTQFVASEPQGRMFLALGQQPPNGVNSIATPRGVLQIAGQGEYEIVAGDTGTPTTITVVQGGGQIIAANLQIPAAAGQTITITGTDQLTGTAAASPPPDPFLSAMLAEIARNDGTLPPAVANMTGCRALATTGHWRASPQYGQVWYPPVQAGWAPYREGHWAYVQPWGWTWVDDESWGFAPFHYGRWIDDGGQWGWVPDAGNVPDEGYQEPVYAPALVSWTDVGEGALVGAAVGAAIGWVALAPNEPYYPPYHRDRGYFDRINRFDVRDIRNVSVTNIRQTNFNDFANRRGAVLAPREAIRSGQQIGRVARPFTPAAFQQARPLPPGRAPLAAPPPGSEHRQPGRGPAINPAFFHPQQLQGGRLPFRGGPAPAAPRAPAAFRPGVPGAPGGMPALRPHGDVEGGRPGAAPPPRPGPAGGPPGFAPGARPEAGHGPQEPGHPGLVAGAAAGAVGAGLAAHALANHGPQGPGPGPGRQNLPAVQRPNEPRPGGPTPPAVQQPRPTFAPLRPQAPRPQPVPHVQQPRPPEPPRAAPPPRPAPHFAPPPQRAAPPPQQHFAPPPQHFAPPPQRFAPPPQHFAPPPQRAAPPPRPAGPPPRQEHH